MPQITLKLPVCDADLANLRASGLTDATIRANQLRTEAGALVFPYRDLGGRVNCFTRWRPHAPRIIDGKLVKYEQQKGSPLRAYFPAGTLAKLRDGKSAVYITEGEKKALALSQLGLAAIGIGGVWCGCKNSTELIDDLAAVAWQGRTVYIVFDHDEKPKTRREVDTARRRLMGALRRAGATEVHTVWLPPGPNGVKQGVDDFLVANGAAAFHEIVNNTGPAIPGEPEEVDAMDLMSEEGAVALESLPLLGHADYVPKGSFTILAAPPKWGKSRLIYECLPAWLEAGETILYLTEESRDSWRHRLAKPRIIDQRGLTLVFGMGVGSDKLLDRVRTGEETVVVADTLRDLGILGDDENDNSGVARAMRPWLTACRGAGKTFIGLHHDRKAGGRHGQGVAGAHSLVAAADKILELRRGKQDNQRILTALGRLASPSDLIYELGDDNALRVLTAGDSELEQLLPDEPPGCTVDDLVLAAKCTKTTALLALNVAVGAGRVVKTGNGKRGDPFRYHRQ